MFVKVYKNKHHEPAQRMDGFMNECMNEWENEWMDGFMNGWIYEWTHGVRVKLQCL